MPKAHSHPVFKIELVKKSALIIPLSSVSYHEDKHFLDSFFGELYKLADQGLIESVYIVKGDLLACYNLLSASTTLEGKIDPLPSTESSTYKEAYIERLKKFLGTHNAEIIRTRGEARGEGDRWLQANLHYIEELNRRLLPKSLVTVGGHPPDAAVLNPVNSIANTDFGSESPVTVGGHPSNSASLLSTNPVLKSVNSMSDPIDDTDSEKGSEVSLLTQDPEYLKQNRFVLSEHVEFVRWQACLDEQANDPTKWGGYITSIRQRYIDSEEFSDSINELISKASTKLAKNLLKKQQSEGNPNKKALSSNEKNHITMCCAAYIFEELPVFLHWMSVGKWDSMLYPFKESPFNTTLFNQLRELVPETAPGNTRTLGTVEAEVVRDIKKPSNSTGGGTVTYSSNGRVTVTIIPNEPIGEGFPSLGESRNISQYQAKFMLTTLQLLVQQHM